MTQAISSTFIFKISKQASNQNLTRVIDAKAIKSSTQMTSYNVNTNVNHFVWLENMAQLNRQQLLFKLLILVLNVVNDKILLKICTKLAKIILS